MTGKAFAKSALWGAAPSPKHHTARSQRWKFAEALPKAETESYIPSPCVPWAHRLGRLRRRSSAARRRIGYHPDSSYGAVAFLLAFGIQSSSPLLSPFLSWHPYSLSTAFLHLLFYFPLVPLAEKPRVTWIRGSPSRNPAFIRIRDPWPKRRRWYGFSAPDRDPKLYKSDSLIHPPSAF